MNILYISHLSGSLYGGPNYSVPSQISAQKKIDNVFWWNLTNPVLKHWIETGAFNNLENYPIKKIESLPQPFNKPDIVVFEDFYYIDDYYLALECRKRKIKYVIVPRGALTKKAQSYKWLKKTAANALFFKSFTRHALAIHYLTEMEKNESTKKWNKNSLVIPNGCQYRERKKYCEKKNAMVGTFIARLMPQKGADILANAVLKKADLLRNNNIRIDIYGPKSYEMWNEIETFINANNIGDVLTINDAVVGLEKQKVLENSDFFVMTSRHEGMPMGLIEALSYSLPCIATKGTNFTDEISSHAAGWTCDNDADCVAEAFSSMCSDKNNFIDYSNNAYELAKNYTWDNIAIKSHELYLKLLEGDKK